MLSVSLMVFLLARMQRIQSYPLWILLEITIYLVCRYFRMTTFSSKKRNDFMMQIYVAEIIWKMQTKQRKNQKISDMPSGFVYSLLILVKPVGSSCSYRKRWNSAYDALENRKAEKSQIAVLYLSSTLKYVRHWSFRTWNELIK